MQGYRRSGDHTLHSRNSWTWKTEFFFDGYGPLDLFSTSRWALPLPYESEGTAGPTPSLEGLPVAQHLRTNSVKYLICLGGKLDESRFAQSIAHIKPVHALAPSHQNHTRKRPPRGPTFVHVAVARGLRRRGRRRRTAVDGHGRPSSHANHAGPTGVTRRLGVTRRSPQGVPANARTWAVGSTTGTTSTTMSKPRSNRATVRQMGVANRLSQSEKK